MKDRLKFRVFLKHNQAMYDIDSFCYLEGLNKSVFHFKQGGQKTLKNDDFVLMQSTGLKDKNGKLIYEGDVVKFRNTDNKFYIGTIKYTDEDALFCLSYKNESNRDDWDYVSRYCLEVIGNIYENLELLKECE